MLILFTNKESFSGETDIINNLFHRGLNRLHLKKDLSRELMIDFLNGIDSLYHPRIVLHDFYTLCDEFDFAGVNLNQRNLNQLQNYNVVSVSCHTLEEVEAIEHYIEYCFLSPIFDSFSKVGYQSNFDLENISDKIKNSKTRIIALGGINISNAEKCLKAGFNGVAVLGCLWNDFKAGNLDLGYKTFEELQNICKDH
jgi:thiamine-phosphate pyrophosphorylase